MGTSDRPVHAGTLEAAADDALAACFNHSGADTQALGPEFGVAHAVAMGAEL